MSSDELDYETEELLETEEESTVQEVTLTDEDMAETIPEVKQEPVVVELKETIPEVKQEPVVVELKETIPEPEAIKEIKPIQEKQKKMKKKKTKKVKKVKKSKTTINYLKLQKVNKFYIQRAHLNRKNVMIMTKDTISYTKLYRKGKKVVVDLFLSENNKLTKHIKYIKSTSFEYVSKERDYTAEQCLKNYIPILKEKVHKYEDGVEEKGYIITMEVDPECIFVKKNELDEIKGDTYKQIKKGENMDIKVIYRGLLYGKSKFKNQFIIQAITRNYIDNLNIDECVFDTSDTEEEITEQDIENKKDKQSKVVFNDLF